MRSVLIFLYAILLLSSCTSESDNKIIEDEHLIQSYEWINSIDSTINSEVVIIRNPSYIECFEKLRSFYDDEINDPGKTRIANNRQDYYKHIDSYGYYHTEMQAILDSMKLKKISLNENQKMVCMISDTDKRFVINLSDFKERHGVIIFNGKDNPTFWNGGGFDKKGLINYLK